MMDSGALVLPVSEQFGPSIQGEGAYAGRTCQFIRLGGCNLSCTFCDTGQTWDHTRFDLAAENPLTPVDVLLENAAEDMLTIITGGEPLMHQRKQSWEYLLDGLSAAGCTIHLETNGTFAPNEITRRYVNAAAISPKLHNAGPQRGNQRASLHPEWRAYLGSSKDPLATNSFLKFVVDTATDVDQAVTYADAVGWPLDRVWVMPQGTTIEQLQFRWPEIVQSAADHGVNACHRLHILAFGDRRGC